MATSLARQLAALQTETRRGRGRASLLFKPRDAEALDVNAVFDIGVNGLAELAVSDSRFSAFELDVFSATWRTADRELQDATANAEINARLAALLRLLSPHLLERAAHKVLEYLIRRFKVHVYNIDAVLAAALPFHDTAFFGRLVQLLEISGSSSVLGPGSSSVPLWAFMAGARTSGSPVSRSVLVAQCVSDTALLRFIADAAAAAAAAAADGLVDPRPAVTLFAVTAAETIAAAPTVSDVLATLVLQQGFAGVRARGCRAYTAAAYALLVALARRASLTPQAWEATVKLVAARACDDAVAADADEAEKKSGRVEDAGVGVQDAVVCLAGLCTLRQRKTRGDGAADALPSKATLSLLRGGALVASTLAAVSARYNTMALVAALGAALPSAVVQKPSLGGATVALLRALPRDALARVVTQVTSDVVLAYAALHGAETVNTRAATALGDILQFLAAVHAESADAGISTALASTSPNLDVAMTWVTSVLCGTRHATTVQLNPDDEEIDDSFSSAQLQAGLNLTVALNHANATIRARAVERLQQLAAHLGTTLEAETAEAGSENSSAGALSEYKLLTTALKRALEDSDAAVVCAAISVHSTLLAEKSDAACRIVAAAASARDPVDASLATIARWGSTSTSVSPGSALLSLASQLQLVLRQWAPVAAQRMPLPPAVEAAVADASSTAGPSVVHVKVNRRERRAAGRIRRVNDGDDAAHDSGDDGDEGARDVAVPSVQVDIASLTAVDAARARSIVEARKVVAAALRLVAGPIISHSALAASPNAAPALLEIAATEVLNALPLPGDAPVPAHVRHWSPDVGAIALELAGAALATKHPLFAPFATVSLRVCSVSVERAWSCVCKSVASMTNNSFLWLSDWRLRYPLSE